MNKRKILNQILVVSIFVMFFIGYNYDYINVLFENRSVITASLFATFYVLILVAIRYYSLWKREKINYSYSCEENERLREELYSDREKLESLRRKISKQRPTRPAKRNNTN